MGFAAGFVMDCVCNWWLGIEGLNQRSLSQWKVNNFNRFSMKSLESGMDAFYVVQIKQME